MSSSVIPRLRALCIASALLGIVGCGVPRATPTPEDPTPPAPLDRVEAATPGTASGANRPPASARPGLGILAVIPGSSGSTSDPTVIAAAAAAGAQYVRISLDWSVSEPEPRQLSFETQNDFRILRIEQAGLRVFPTLYVGRGWMNGTPSGRQEGESRSFPPGDLSNLWDPAFGYSQDYAGFLHQFFSHYRGHFDYVAIENEASSMLFWGGTPDEYVRLLKTAYTAIKSADPDVQVIDSGFVSAIGGLCMIRDLRDSGAKSDQELLQIAREYYSSETGRFQPDTSADLEAYLENARVQEQCERVSFILQEMDGAVDAINFHFYEDYRALPPMVAWLATRLGRASPNPSILTNEMGQRGPDVAFAQSDAHAQAVFKKLITGLSLGLEAMVWFSADTIGTDAPSPDKVGLFGEGGSLRPAAEAFRVVSQVLSTGYQFDRAIFEGPDVYHYVLVEPGSGTQLHALWTEAGPQLHTVSLAPECPRATITDYSGESRTVQPQAEGITFLLDDPVLVACQ